MKQYREIYRAEQLPVFQNRMFHSEFCLLYTSRRHFI